MLLHQQYLQHIHQCQHGNDILPVELVEKYFKDYWVELGIEKEEFFGLGMKPKDEERNTFNMGILALKVAGKKNGVSKLHGAVSRELFGEVWPNIAANESPITHITNGIHTCTWLAPNLKELYNEYLAPFWQDKIHLSETWTRIENIPNNKLWDEHVKRKQKLIRIITENVTTRLRNSGVHFEEIGEITSKLNPKALTIGFSRRFATYKRATLIFKDLERITQILNNKSKPVQLVFAGKAHPADKEGQDLIKYIHEMSMTPQFRGKIFILENYNMEMARYLISGVDVWLNNPRRPLEASGTSGEKASVNGVVNFSILDGWWAEGYNSYNGWAIGTNAEFESYNEQDKSDSESMYNILENKIIPIYYDVNQEGYSEEWMKIMKNSIMSTGGQYSTARMLVDYTNNLYIPLCNLTNRYYNKLDLVTEYNGVKEEIYRNWTDIEITQTNNLDNIVIDAGHNIKVACMVKLPNINVDNIEAQAYCGKIMDNGTIENIGIITMDLTSRDDEKREYEFEAKIELKTGGNYGYTFRVMPKHEMLLDNANWDLVKWITN